MSKKILIIDPFSTGRFYSKLFSEKGFECVAIKSSDVLSKFYTDSFDNKYFINDNLYSVDFVKGFFKNNDIFAVLAGSETGVIEAERLARFFEVQGNDPSNSKLRRNKLEMQKELEKNNLRNINTKAITENDKDISYLDENQPYVLKPLDSLGSENVIFCQDRNDLDDKIENLQWGKRNITGSINNSYLVQPFIEGDEFVIDMIVCDKNIIVSALCVYGKIKLNGSGFIYKNMCTLDMNDEKYAELIQYAKSAAHALKYQFGLVHMEIIAKNEGGKITNPTMIEAGGRIHGGVAPLLFEQCYSPDLLNQSVHLILNGNVDGKGMKVNEGRVVFMINSIENGAIDSEAFTKEISSLASFKNVVFTNDSQSMPVTVDLITCPCLICLVHEDEFQVEQDEEMAFEIFNRLCS